ncbi:hypothetical protein [Amedibacillus sp. YH-ame10]
MDSDENRTLTEEDYKGRIIIMLSEIHEVPVLCRIYNLVLKHFINA